MIGASEIDPNRSDEISPPVLPGAVVDEVSLPNLSRIVALWNAGNTVLLGWKNGGLRVSRLTRQERTRLVNANDALHPDRKAASRWLRRKEGHRLVVVLGSAFFCLNFDAKQGFTLEPNT